MDQIQNTLNRLANSQEQTAAASGAMLQMQQKHDMPPDPLVTTYKSTVAQIQELLDKSEKTFLNKMEQRKLNLLIKEQNNVYSQINSKMGNVLKVPTMDDDDGPVTKAYLKSFLRDMASGDEKPGGAGGAGGPPVAETPKGRPGKKRTKKRKLEMPTGDHVPETPDDTKYKDLGSGVFAKKNGDKAKEKEKGSSGSAYDWLNQFNPFHGPSTPEV